MPVEADPGAPTGQVVHIPHRRRDRRAAVRRPRHAGLLGQEARKHAADLLVADQIVVELKTDPEYQPAHEAQLLNELKGTRIRLGYLVNFGRSKVEFKRMVM